MPPHCLTYAAVDPTSPTIQQPHRTRDVSISAQRYSGLSTNRYRQTVTASEAIRRATITQVATHFNIARPVSRRVTSRDAGAGQRFHDALSDRLYQRLH